MARILWTSSGNPGGYFPIVPLLTQMRRRGHELVVYSGADELKCDLDSLI